VQVPTDVTGLTVVSNREPYVHRHAADGVTVDRPSGGLVTALDRAVGAVGGDWVAWGSGDADFEAAVLDDPEAGRVAVPPGEERYDLHRVALSPGERERYYYGYSNQVLWPLCHTDTEYVDVDPAFWPGYRAVNERFAGRVLATDPGAVWLHDYHLALAPATLRAERPDLRTVQFWHVPWPAEEVWGIGPHARELLEGLLGNDAVGFHTEAYRENFLESVVAHVPEATVVGTEVGYEGRRVETFVAPIGVDPGEVARVADTDRAAECWSLLERRHGIDDDTDVLLGVDRLDYAKGLLERLDALAYLWRERPAMRGAFTHVLKGTVSREGVASYRRYHGRVRDRVHDLNREFGTDDWTPVLTVEENLDRAELAGLYGNADALVVSSRRDGMNLVAKEFVAAARDGAALVLSEFAGAAEALGEGALVANPFDTVAFADAVAEAVAMDDAEAADRMATMRAAVREQTVYDWLAANLDRLS
jgi:trehalose-6-phosphate synthase